MLNAILTTSNYVVENAKDVKINDKVLKETSKKLKTLSTDHWLSSNPYNLLDLNIKDLINYLIIYGSMDYSFWGTPKWTIKTSSGEEDGAFALIKCLLDLFNNKKHLNFEEITLDEFKEALKGNIEIPLLEERYFNALEISKIINTKMNGNFYEYTKDITNDIELLDLIVENFPSFKDTRTYNQKVIYFYKLAQLVTSDILNIRKLKENIEVDITNLIGCADYKIPQALRALGILEYSEKLSALIDNKEEIEENSSYEVEIRASMIIAVNRLHKLLPEISSITINDLIWVLSHDSSLNLLPYHRTRTTSY